MDIAPTLLFILNISSKSKLTREGKSLPIREGNDLRVTGAPAGLELWQGEARLANGTAGDYCFGGLPRGLYSLKAGGKEWAVLVNGDVAMDLAGKAASGRLEENNQNRTYPGHKPRRNCTYHPDLERKGIRS